MGHIEFRNHSSHLGQKGVSASTLVPGFDADLKAQKDRRQNSRLSYEMTVWRSSDQGFFIEEQILDVSRSGICLRTEEFLNPGDKVEIMLQLPKDSQEVTLQAYVVHVFADPESDSPTGLLDANEFELNGQTLRTAFRVGLYLGFVEPAQKKLLQEFIESRLKLSEDVEFAKRESATLRERPRGVSRKTNLRICVELSGPDPELQARQLKKIREQGLYIDVSEPLSLFDSPSVWLRNPLTEQGFDLPNAEIVQAELISPAEVEAPVQSLEPMGLSTLGAFPWHCDPKRHFRLHLRFNELSHSNLWNISRLLAGLA